MNGVLANILNTAVIILWFAIPIAIIILLAMWNLKIKERRERARREKLTPEEKQEDNKKRSEVENVLYLLPGVIFFVFFRNYMGLLTAAVISAIICAVVDIIFYNIINFLKHK